MKHDMALKLVDALRSGKYQQGFGQLCHNNHYCCLGVVCEISGVEYSLFDDMKYYGLALSSSLLPEEVQGMFGFLTKSGRFKNPINSNGKTYDSLIQMNDNAGVPFNEIADVIEKHWEEL